MYILKLFSLSFVMKQANNWLYMHAYMKNVLAYTNANEKSTFKK